MLATHKYKAFISYSHHDLAIARWLHRALETYRPPRGIASQTSSSDQNSKFKLRPIFRDEDELVVSANLNDSLVEAIQQSEFLIVICSPSSANSKWASQEIIEFKKNRGADNVIAVIADGDPENCFPEPLLREVLPSGELGAASLEPLAADMQGGRASRRLAFLKVAATMLGTGLDQLVQREAQRRHRFLAMVTTAALIGMLVMGWLTFTAVTERRAADEARAVAEHSEQMAEQRREEAEGLIEFMLTDLRDKLEPVGRLDVLDAVGVKALDYYGQQDEQQLEPESLGRRARALHLLGEISNLKGDSEAALSRFTLAAETTARQLELDPANPQRIFDHAQSVYWLGLHAYFEGRHSAASQAFEDYLAHAKQLVAIDAEDQRWLLELYYGNSNLGGLLVEQQRWQEAVPSLERALEVLLELERLGYPQAQFRADTHSWLRAAHIPQMNFGQAQFHIEQEINGYQALIKTEPSNPIYQLQLVVVYRGAAQLALIRNDVEGALEQLAPQAAELAALIAFEPDNTAPLEQQAQVYRDLAEIAMLQADWAQASVSVKQCQEVANALLQLNESNQFWRNGLSRSCHYIAAEVAYHQGQIEQAQSEINTYYAQLLEEYSVGVDIKELELLLAKSSLLLGDLASANADQNQATEYWQHTTTVLADEKAFLEPASIVTRIEALNRLDKKAEAKELADYLLAAEYRHPAFLRVADGSR